MTKYNLASSAYSNNLQDTNDNDKSFIYIKKKNKGPKFEPWGIPEVSWTR